MNDEITGIELGQDCTAEIVWKEEGQLLRCSPNLSVDPPKRALDFIELVEACTQATTVTASIPGNQVQEIKVSPKTKIIWQGWIIPSDLGMCGKNVSKRHYLIQIQSPQQAVQGLADYFWFEEIETFPQTKDTCYF